MELFKILGTIAIEGAEKAEKALDSVTGTAKKVQSTFAPVTKAIGGAAVALGGGGAAAIKMASDYDTAFAQVSTLLNGSESDLEKYKKNIVAASNETGKSTTEMSNAIYNAISAGVQQGEAIEFTTNAMKLAKGGFTDATTAVDVLTTAINAYGLQSSDATSIADKLITTQNLGKTTVDELASSMGKIIPTANSLDVNIDQLCAGYAVMTSNGIATAETTTYMNSMLNELGKSGTTAQKALAEYTKSTMGSSKSMKELMAEGYSLDDVLGMLQESAKASGLSIADMFGSAEAGKAATVLLTNAEQFKSSVDSMKNSAGATEEAYNKMDNTLASKMEKMKTRFQNIGIELGEKLFPVVEKGMTWVEENMPSIQENIDKLAPVIMGLIQVVVDQGLPALTKVMEVIGKVVDWFVKLDDGQKKLMITVVAVIAAISPLAGVIAGISTAAGVLVSAFSFILSPAGLVVAAIAAVIAIGVAVYKNWDTIKAKAQELGAKISAKWDEIKQNTSAKWDSIKAKTSETWNNMKSKASEAWNGMKDTMSNAVESARNYVSGKLDAIKQKYQENGGGIKGIVAASMEAVRQHFSVAYDAINSLTGGRLDAVRQKFSSVFENVKSTVSNAIESIKSKFNFSWSLPHLKMPHPRISGNFSLNPPSVPSFSIDWYAKAMDDPMIMNSPTAFGINKLGQIMAGGEAGSEVVSGTETLMTMISDAVGQKNEAVVAKLEKLIQILIEFFPQLLDGRDIILDSGELVGATVSKMDEALGKMTIRKTRYV